MLPLLLSSRPGIHTAAAVTAAASPQLLRHLNCLAFHGHTINWSWLSAGSSSSSNNKHGAGIAAVAAAAALCSILQSQPAHADAVADDDSNISTTYDAAKRAGFTAWLTSRGADMSAVSVQQSSVRVGAQAPCLSQLLVAVSIVSGSVYSRVQGYLRGAGMKPLAGRLNNEDLPTPTINHHFVGALKKGAVVAEKKLL